MSRHENPCSNDAGQEVGTSRAGRATRADAIDVAAVLAAGFATRVEHHRVLTSTNDRARQLAAELGRPDVLLVIADRQTAGRGRGTNRWWTGRGSLAFSLLFDPSERGLSRPAFPLISLAAAVAIVETMAPLVPGCAVGLHWPNDVFAAGRKLAGILVEALADGRVVTGMGLNLNNSTSEAPAELAGLAVTLSDLSGQAYDRTRVLIDLLEQFRRALNDLAASPASLASRANELCMQRGQVLTIENGGRRSTGICAGISADGALLLETIQGREAFYSGVLKRM